MNATNNVASAIRIGAAKIAIVVIIVVIAAAVITAGAAGHITNAGGTQ